MINHKHKFIFIRTAKTASTSILSTLRDELFKYKKGGLSPWAKYKRCKINTNGFRYDYNHPSASHIQNKYPNKFENYFTAAFTRNPWDRLVSIWKMNKRTHHCTFPLLTPDFLPFVRSLSTLEWMPAKGNFPESPKAVFNYKYGNISDFTANVILTCPGTKLKQTPRKVQ